jgi:hypothetical protein
MLQKTKELQTTNPLDFIKNPAILDTEIDRLMKEIELVCKEW